MLLIATMAFGVAAKDVQQHLGLPAGAEEQEGGNAAAGEPQEERRLYRGLSDLLIDELERL
jgi:hypothetical protein